jgi:hypothetical protein
MSRPDSTALRLEPAGWPTPLVPPIVTVLFVLISLAAVLHWAWSLLEPAHLADPRPAVRGFVNAVRAGAMTEGDCAALEKYWLTLSPRGRWSLAHDVNYLLYRDGRPERFDFDERGVLCILMPEIPLQPATESGPVVVVPPAPAPVQPPPIPVRPVAPTPIPPVAPGSGDEPCLEKSAGPNGGAAKEVPKPSKKKG